MRLGHRNKTSKIQSALHLTAYFLLSCPAAFLLEFLPSELHPESKAGRQRTGLPLTSGAKLAFLAARSPCSKCSRLLSSDLFVILNFLISALSPFDSQVSGTPGEGQRYVQFTIKAISEVPQDPDCCNNILVHRTYLCV